jgi:dihydroflavonol-4-reductase
VRDPWIGIPRDLVLTLGSVNQVIGEAVGRDFKFVKRALSMWDAMSALDHGKAQRELGWKPEPFERSVADAVRFYRDHGMT